MPPVVKTRIIKIGNSQGIRIPKHLLEQTNLSDEVELEFHSEQIVVRPAHEARHNWDELFKAMAEAGDDRLVDGEEYVPTTWDEEEWEW